MDVIKTDWNYAPHFLGLGCPISANMDEERPTLNEKEKASVSRKRPEPIQKLKEMCLYLETTCWTCNCEYMKN